MESLFIFLSYRPAPNQKERDRVRSAMPWVGLHPENAASGPVHPSVPHMKDNNHPEISWFLISCKNAR